MWIITRNHIGILKNGDRLYFQWISLIFQLYAVQKYIATSLKLICTNRFIFTDQERYLRMMINDSKVLHS